MFWLIAWISINGLRFNPAERALKEAPQPTPYWLVHFEGPIHQRWRNTLESLGFRVLFYVPQHTYVVRAVQPRNKLDLQEIQKHLPAVRWTGPFLPDYKIHPNYRHKIQNNPDAVDTVVISLFPGEDLKPVEERIRLQGGEVLQTWQGPPDYFSRVVAVVRREALLNLAQIQAVAHVERRPHYRLWNDRDRWVLQTNRVSNTNPDTAVWAAGIHGEGQILTVMDSELDANSCFFSDDPNKVIANIVYPGAETGGPSGAHGTHVAGTALGYTTDATNWVYNGLAYRARLVFQDVGDLNESLSGIPASLVSAFQEAYDYGSRIHTNSWGASVNEYRTDDADVDYFTYRHPTFTILFAMGNDSRGNASEDGTIGSPATSKNAVSVGATGEPTLSSQTQDYRADYSSQGPTYDGRIKPTVMAPGGACAGTGCVRGYDPKVSANAYDASGCGTTTMLGTSMATPAAAGAAVLVRQYFTDGFYPTGSANAADAFEPLGALIKAMLVASTDTMDPSEGTIPNSEIGWGRINLKNVLFFTGDPFRLFVVNGKRGPFTGDTLVYTVEVQDNTVPLKVTLVWSDYFAYPSTNPALVNDLDLVVIAPSGTQYLGNVFNGNWSTTGGSRDSLNVVEGVRIQNPEVGTWTVYVIGTNVPMAYQGEGGYFGQPFGLVVTYGGGTPAPALTLHLKDTLWVFSRCDNLTALTVDLSNTGGTDLVISSVTSPSSRFTLNTVLPLTVSPRTTVSLSFAIDTTGLGNECVGDVCTWYFPVEILSNAPTSPDTFYVRLYYVKNAGAGITSTYVEDFETSDGGWTGTGDWIYATLSNGNRGWLTGAGGYSNSSQSTLTAKTIFRGYSCNARIILTHAYQSEQFFDGGNVKFSLDNTSWYILHPLRGYPASLYGDAGTGYTPAWIGKQPAFTGTTAAYVSDTFDLTQGVYQVLAKGGSPPPPVLLGDGSAVGPGDTIYLRFDFGSDDNTTGGFGWAIDAITAEGLDTLIFAAIDLGLTVTESPTRILFSWKWHPLPRGIRLTLASSSPVQIRLDLMDVTGRIRWKREVRVDGTVVLDIQKNILPGLYFLRVNRPGGKSTQRVVVIR